MLKNKVKYFFENNFDNKVHSTSDETLFIQKQDAVAHGKTLENKDVDTHYRSGFSEDEAEITSDLSNDQAGLQEKANQAKKDNPKPTPTELKALKEKAIAEYKEVFEAEPDTKLSGANIQKLVDAKKEELAKAQNPE